MISCWRRNVWLWVIRRRLNERWRMRRNVMTHKGK